jgi:hypothetical protein
LFVVWAGANDVLDTQITSMTTPVNRLGTDIGRLVAGGARQLLVFNLPPMGETPRFNLNATNRATYNSRTTQFNNALASMLDGLEISNPALTIFRVDVAAMISQAIANPPLFGLTDVTRAAAPGLQPGATSYNTSQIAPNVSQYLFWDDLHPTTTVHAILSQRVLSLTLMRGDYNRDGDVDVADFVMWRKQGGVHFTPEHYAAWREDFGRSPGSGSASDAENIVAEPAISLLAVMVVAWGCMPRRKFRL